MKKSIFILISALFLIACSNDRQQQSHDAENRWNGQYSVVQEDPTSQEASPTDSVESPIDKPTAASSASKGTTKQSSKSSDNMRGFDPASEDDMDDNGMSRYFDNNDDEGWD